MALRAREIESLDDQRLLRLRMECLESRERTILSLRYGLDNEPPMTLKEIGDRLGVTREWVRKIEFKAIRKLRGEVPATPNAGMRRRSRTMSRRRSKEPATPAHAALEIRGQQKGAADFRLARRSRALPIPSPIPAAAPPIWNSHWPLLAATTPAQRADAVSNA